MQNIKRFIDEIGSEQKEFEIFSKAQYIANRELVSESALIDSIKSYFYQQSLEPLLMQRVYALKLRDLYLEAKKPE